MNSERKSMHTKTPKGEQTRALILNTALDLLRERGYERTTMRAIANKAGVSLGNAYHYFGSKEHLIQAFYHRLHEEHLAAILPARVTLIGVIVLEVALALWIRDSLLLNVLMLIRPIQAIRSE